MARTCLRRAIRSVMAEGQLMFCAPDYSACALGPRFLSGPRRRATILPAVPWGGVAIHPAVSQHLHHHAGQRPRPGSSVEAPAEVTAVLADLAPGQILGLGASHRNGGRAVSDQSKQHGAQGKLLDCRTDRPRKRAGFFHAYGCWFRAHGSATREEFWQRRSKWRGVE